MLILALCLVPWLVTIWNRETPPEHLRSFLASCLRLSAKMIKPLSF
jgi:hypothetical protein